MSLSQFGFFMEHACFSRVAENEIWLLSRAWDVIFLTFFADAALPLSVVDSFPLHSLLFDLPAAPVGIAGAPQKLICFPLSDDGFERKMIDAAVLSSCDRKHSCVWFDRFLRQRTIWLRQEAVLMCNY